MRRDAALFFTSFFLTILPFFVGLGFAFLSVRATDSNTFSLSMGQSTVVLRLFHAQSTLEVDMLTDRASDFAAFETVLLSRPTHTAFTAIRTGAQVFPMLVDAYNEYLFALENG